MAAMGSPTDSRSCSPAAWKNKPIRMDKASGDRDEHDALLPTETFSTTIDSDSDGDERVKKIDHAAEARRAILSEGNGDSGAVFTGRESKVVAARESDYQKKRFARDSQQLSPTRNDAFAR